MTEVQRVYGGIPLQIWTEMNNELLAKEEVQSKDGLRELLVQMKQLVLEMKTLAEAFPAEVAARRLPPPMSDAEAIIWLRNRMGDGEELRLMRDYIDEDYSVALNLGEVERKIVRHCQYRVTPAGLGQGGGKRTREEGAEDRQGGHRAQHMAAAAVVFSVQEVNAIAEKAAGKAVEAVLWANAAQGVYGMGGGQESGGGYGGGYEGHGGGAYGGYNGMGRGGFGRGYGDHAGRRER
jgi:hypothetical protein